MATRNVELVRRSLETVFNGGNVAQAQEFFSRNLLRLVEEGIQENRRAFPDLTYEITQIEDNENEVHFLYVVKGTNEGSFLGQEPTGRTIQWEGRAQARISDDGVISRINVHEDQYAKLVKLGLDRVVPSMRGSWTTEGMGIQIRTELNQRGTAILGTFHNSMNNAMFQVTGTNLYPTVRLSCKFDERSTLTFQGRFSSPDTVSGTYTLDSLSGLAKLERSQ